MTQQKFIFDTDCLIIAKRFYSPDFSGAFWEWLIAGNQNQVFFLADKVINELKQGDEEDYLYKFADEYGDNFKLATSDHSCLVRYAEIQNWAATQWAAGKDKNKVRKALEVFARETLADPWQVAYASIHNCIIVTNEESAPASQTNIKLPDVARAFGVKTIKLQEILGAYSGQNFTFKLAS
jgi:hypothetical protein